MKQYDALIVGAGFAGAVTARRLAEAGWQVCVLEQRNHIGGNAYDEPDENQILIQPYGPHIYHTSEREVHEFLSRFTEWTDYSHEVVAKVGESFIPVPFNLNTLEMVYGSEKAAELEKKLVDAFGAGSRVPILQLREHPDEEIRGIADYVYENIFLHYTMKQWGQTPEEIDPAVTGRVPVVLSRDNRYFQDTWQGMPKDGFTSLFQKMLAHENITVRLGVRSQNVLQFDADGTIRWNPKLVQTGAVSEEMIAEQKALEPYDGVVIYTGPVDELFAYRYGHLPYRTLNFVWERYDRKDYQEHAVVNYTVDEEFTRITEFAKLYPEVPQGAYTTIVKEYPQAYKPDCGQIPYYAIINEENNRLYQRYQEEAGKYSGLYLLGRLAEYKYYNMDAITKQALELSERLIERKAYI